MSRTKKILIAVAALVVLALLATVVTALLLLREVNVPTPAMANTILLGDRVLCLMMVGEITRGDIVMFRLPEDPQVLYFKRVIGLPGERVQLRGVKVYINDQELAETRTFVAAGDLKDELKELSSEGQGNYRVCYVNLEDRDEPFTVGMKYGVNEPYLIPEGHYYLLGDNRDNSLDSRFWGTVSRDLIVGRALMITGSNTPGREQRKFISLK
jgi:signal peptidase I